MRWFDAHLDLAYLADNGRDMTRPIADCGGPDLPAAITFPSLAAGNVKACLGTIFTESDGKDSVGYPAGDSEAAHAAGVRQLEWYDRWRSSGLIAPLRNAHGQASIRVGILMECADPIRNPAELSWWVARGVIAIGLAWARGSRYASGNSAPSCDSNEGLTQLGRDLVKQMDQLGIVHDASHLSDRALSDLFSATSQRVMASHSNCRALLDESNQRHLTDAAIKSIDSRGGVIGLNLFAKFIRKGIKDDQRPAIAEAINHVDHICQLVGHQRAVGLGSDLDGGFSAQRLPEGINNPSGFDLLAEELLRRGWSEEGVHAFAWGNWARFWSLGD